MRRSAYTRHVKGLFSPLPFAAHFAYAVLHRDADLLLTIFPGVRAYGESYREFYFLISYFQHPCLQSLKFDTLAFFFGTSSPKARLRILRS